MRNIRQIHLGIVQSAGSHLAEVLHKQEIDLVTDDIRLRLFSKKVLQKAHQTLRSHLRVGLQKLPELVHLDHFVHVIEPLISLLDSFFSGRLNARFEIGASFDFHGELTREFEVDGIQTTGQIPLRCEILHRCGRGHDFTIQLGTLRLKRAATRMLPGWYCTATTRASSSSEPSVVRTRSKSAKSNGVLQAKSTSRGVPNSITVLSLKVAGSVSSTTRASCTGMRTGVASGKKRARPATGLSLCEMRAVATACCAK